MSAQQEVDSYTQVLKFHGQKQKKENWCFAAVTASIHNFYDPNNAMSQEDVVELVFNAVVDKPASARLALNGVGHLGAILNRMANWSEIQTELIGGRPIVVSSGKHVLVVYGFKIYSDGRDLLYFYDSEENGPRSLSYAAFNNEYGVEYSYLTRS